MQPGIVVAQKAGFQPLDRLNDNGRDEMDLIMDAATYEAEFMVGLSGLIAEIYDKDLPFSPTDNKMRCNTCPFASLCK